MLDLWGSNYWGLHWLLERRRCCTWIFRNSHRVLWRENMHVMQWREGDQGSPFQWSMGVSSNKTTTNLIFIIYPGHSFGSANQFWLGENIQTPCISCSYCSWIQTVLTTKPSLYWTYFKRHTNGFIGSHEISQCISDMILRCISNSACMITLWDSTEYCTAYYWKMVEKSSPWCSALQPPSIYSQWAFGTIVTIVLLYPVFWQLYVCFVHRW